VQKIKEYLIDFTNLNYIHDYMKVVVHIFDPNVTHFQNNM